MRCLPVHIELLLLTVATILLSEYSAAAQDFLPPAHLIAVNSGLPGKHSVQLKWEFANDSLDSIYLLLERSPDGLTYHAIYQELVLPQSDRSVYYYTDYFAMNDSVFYRLLRKDRTGERLVSEVQKIQFALKSGVEVMVMPNPVFNNASLIINGEGLGDIVCVLYDLSGKLIRTYQIKKLSVYMQQILDMYSVPRGEYILNIRGAFINETKRILKQ
ncbi:MAG: T9SS type A sorting domain-containing protein [Chitinophagaceae bacterium]|nr:T9SS type A sorting domain-containing protein [Chitinophagaceae bacterium]